MKLVPVPINEKTLRKLSRIWLPFLENISRESGEPLEDLEGYVLGGQVRIALAFDDAGRAVALGGAKLWQRGGAVVGDIVWCSGKDRNSYQHLLSEFEALLRDAGCSVVRPIARYGWTKFLKAQGYKMSHVIMEKQL